MTPDEPPAELPRCCVPPPLPPDAAVPGSVACVAIGHLTRFWPPGSILRVRFLDGTAARRRAVLGWASEYSAVCGIAFAESRARDAEVRVTFRPGGSWSYIGQDARWAPPGQPTMQLGWGPDRPTTLHEFGHALGLDHEQGHPHADIPWDRPRVYAYYFQSNGWPQSLVDSQVFAAVQGGSLVMTDYDSRSIMHYPVDAALLTDPSRAVPWNTELSPRDKQFLRRYYGPPARRRDRSPSPRPDSETRP